MNPQYPTIIQWGILAFAFSGIVFLTWLEFRKPVETQEEFIRKGGVK